MWHFVSRSPSYQLCTLFFPGAADWRVLLKQDQQHMLLTQHMLSHICNICGLAVLFYYNWAPASQGGPHTALDTRWGLGGLWEWLSMIWQKGLWPCSGAHTRKPLCLFSSSIRVAGELSIPQVCVALVWDIKLGSFSYPVTAGSSFSGPWAPPWPSRALCQAQICCCGSSNHVSSWEKEGQEQGQAPELETVCWAESHWVFISWFPSLNLFVLYVSIKILAGNRPNADSEWLQRGN